MEKGLVTILFYTRTRTGFKCNLPSLFFFDMNLKSRLEHQLKIRDPVLAQPFYLKDRTALYIF